MIPSFDKLIEAEFDENCQLLTTAGFPNVESAVQYLMRLREASLESPRTDELSRGHSVPPWFKTLKRILVEAPFPMAVLDAADRYVASSRSTNDAFLLFDQSPRSMEILARLACCSPFLTQVLLRQPDSLVKFSSQQRTADMKSREQILAEATEAIAAPSTTQDKLAALRSFQQQEILRIGMCDAFGLMDLKFVTLQLSLVADAMVQLCLKLACEEFGLAAPPFAVIALGKHGGEELNYSSDIDLVLIAGSDVASAQRVARRLIDGLTEPMARGFLYRVDMRLRPWGTAGPLVNSLENYDTYIREHASLWEKQALLKARVVAGDAAVGQQLLDKLPALLFTENKQDVLANVRQLKGRIEKRLRKAGKLETEVKLGAGSIRDIEFLVQALQLVHGKHEPRVASANTLDALVRLTEFGLIDVTTYRRLREGYVFLRTIEHALQLLHNQQTHELPNDVHRREWLARRLDYPGEDELLQRFEEHRETVRSIFNRHLGGRTEDVPESVDSHPVLTPQTTYQPILSAHFATHAEDHLDQVKLAFAAIDAGAQCYVASAKVAGHANFRLITIAAPEVPGLTSMLFGVFFASHIDIREGETINGGGQSHFGYAVPTGRFLGVFLCDDGRTQQPSMTDGRLQQHLERLLNLSHESGSEAVRQALVQLFCEHVTHVKPLSQTLDAVETDLKQDQDEQVTIVTISADDSPGFFFELSNSLTICGFRILRAQLGVEDGRIEDVLDVVESTGGPVTAPHRIEELRIAVTLIKQFTNWVPSCNDPHEALLRFRDLLQTVLQTSGWQDRVAGLKHPRVLRDVGQVLGLSRFLWEDFLRVNTEDLLPLLTDRDRLPQQVSRTELETELQTRLHNTATADKQAACLNQFKDYHLFRIDLRHVLGHSHEFGKFSEEITELAEVTVAAAFRVAMTELAATHGEPILPDGRPCPFTIAALGKFGGVEMGFASDIEMFVVYQENCRTNGSQQLSAGSFFERVTGRASELIQSRHKGVFELDLRMRPYGQAGSPAVSLTSFTEYFCPDGPAWPYERQSLVRLRAIGNDADFAATLENTCRRLIYSSRSFDFDAMRAMREKQIRQLVHGGTINAKLSSGGLVDCEYAVQALQLTFGATCPQLQSPNTETALTAASDAALLTPDEFSRTRTAYRFLRELIDGLRMARGNAHDLTIPEQGTDEDAQLARRTAAVHGSQLDLTQLENHLQAIRDFAVRVEEICTADVVKTR